MCIRVIYEESEMRGSTACIVGLTLWDTQGRDIIIPDRQSHLQTFAVDSVPSIPFVKVPVYVGFALRTHTASLCKQSF